MTEQVLFHFSLIPKFLKISTKALKRWKNIKVKYPLCYLQWSLFVYVPCAALTSCYRMYIKVLSRIQYRITNGGTRNTFFHVYNGSSGKQVIKLWLRRKLENVEFNLPLTKKTYLLRPLIFRNQVIFVVELTEKQTTNKTTTNE